MSKIKLEVDDFKVIIDPDELELREEVKGEIPSEEEAKDEDFVVDMYSYNVRICREAVGNIKVKAPDKYSAVERAEDKLLPSEYELEGVIHEEATKLGSTKVDVKRGEEYSYKSYIFNEYGYDCFKLKGWQLALLNSEDQTTLKRWGVTNIKECYEKEAE